MAGKKNNSIHLCDYPEVQSSVINLDLEKTVSLSREVVKMGRALREKHKLKTRQPLGRGHRISRQRRSRTLKTRNTSFVKNKR